MLIILLLLWFYHQPTLQGVSEDELEWATETNERREEISFEAGKEGFLKLQSKYDYPLTER